MNLFSSLMKPKNKFSIENLRYLHNTLKNNQVITPKNKSLIVESLRQIAEVMIWGDQHDNLFFDFFLEKNIMGFFISFLSQKTSNEVTIQLLQTLSILIENLRNENSIYFVLSNNYVNEIIIHKFDFSSEEVLDYYISFLKALSLKLDKNTVNFFFNHNEKDFPLYTEAIKFINHKETMIRIAVRTLTLNIFKVENKEMREYIINSTAVPYFSNIVWFIRRHCINLSNILEKSNHDNISQLKYYVEELTDQFYYLHDIFNLGFESMNIVLAEQFVQYLIFPVFIGSLIDPAKNPDLEDRITPTLALFLLAQLFHIFTFKPLLDAVSSALFTSTPEFDSKLFTTKTTAPPPLSSIGTSRRHYNSIRRISSFPNFDSLEALKNGSSISEPDFGGVNSTDDEDISPPNSGFKPSSSHQSSTSSSPNTPTKKINFSKFFGSTGRRPLQQSTGNIPSVSNINNNNNNINNNSNNNISKQPQLSSSIESNVNSINSLEGENTNSSINNTPPAIVVFGDNNSEISTNENITHVDQNNTPPVSTSPINNINNNSNNNNDNSHDNSNNSNNDNNNNNIDTNTTEIKSNVTKKRFKFNRNEFKESLLKFIVNDRETFGVVIMLYSFLKNQSIDLKILEKGGILPYRKKLLDSLLSPEQNNNNNSNNSNKELFQTKSSNTSPVHQQLLNFKNKSNKMSSSLPINIGHNRSRSESYTKSLQFTQNIYDSMKEDNNIFKPTTPAASSLFGELEIETTKTDEGNGNDECDEKEKEILNLKNQINLSSNNCGDESDDEETFIPVPESSQKDFTRKLINSLFMVLVKSNQFRLVTLQMTLLILKELVYSSDTSSKLTETQALLLEQAYITVTDNLKEYLTGSLSEVFLEIFEEELKSYKQIIFEQLINDVALILPIPEKLVTRLSLPHRLPTGELERTQKAIQQFLVLRDLKFTLLRKKDNLLPLKQPPTPMVREKFWFNLDIGGEESFYDIIQYYHYERPTPSITPPSSSGITRKKSKQFGVLFHNLLLAVDPVSNNPLSGSNGGNPPQSVTVIGGTNNKGLYGIIVHIAPLQRLEIEISHRDQSILKVTSHPTTWNVEMVFDEVNQCNKAKQLLERARDDVRANKMRQIYALLGEKDPDDDSVQIKIDKSFKVLDNNKGEIEFGDNEYENNISSNHNGEFYASTSLNNNSINSNNINSNIVNNTNTNTNTNTNASVYSIPNTPPSRIITPIDVSSNSHPLAMGDDDIVNSNNSNKKVNSGSNKPKSRLSSPSTLSLRDILEHKSDENINSSSKKLDIFSSVFEGKLDLKLDDSSINGSSNSSNNIFDDNPFSDLKKPNNNKDIQINKANQDNNNININGNTQSNDSNQNKQEEIINEEIKQDSNIVQIDELNESKQDQDKLSAKEEINSVEDVIEESTIQETAKESIKEVCSLELDQDIKPVIEESISEPIKDHQNETTDYVEDNQSIDDKSNHLKEEINSSDKDRSNSNEENIKTIIESQNELQTIVEEPINESIKEDTKLQIESQNELQTIVEEDNESVDQLKEGELQTIIDESKEADELKEVSDDKQDIKLNETTQSQDINNNNDNNNNDNNNNDNNNNDNNNNENNNNNNNNSNNNNNNNKNNSNNNNNNKKKKKKRH